MPIVILVVLGWLCWFFREEIVAFFVVVGWILLAVAIGIVIWIFYRYIVKPISASAEKNAAERSRRKAIGDLEREILTWENAMAEAQIVKSLLDELRVIAEPGAVIGWPRKGLWQSELSSCVDAGVQDYIDSGALEADIPEHLRDKPAEPPAPPPPPPTRRATLEAVNEEQRLAKLHGVASSSESMPVALAEVAGAPKPSTQPSVPGGTSLAPTSGQDALLAGLEQRKAAQRGGVSPAKRQSGTQEPTTPARVAGGTPPTSVASGGQPNALLAKLEAKKREQRQSGQP